uniref:CRAL-TRIO domain-containing protein n=1 Tax=Panagrolaimus superbus TaxID=310955 RepID=A0A914YRX6_9BILA
MISLRKQRGVKNNRNSLLVTGSITSDALIQFVFNADCFRNKDIGSLNTKDTFSIYNYLCSLLVYSIKHLKPDVPVIILIDAAKIPIKALRLILKACQNVLAFRSKHVVIAQPDSFFEQQKLSLDILLESYDFKTTLCSKNKLWKYVNVADLADAFTPSFNTWNDIRKGFEEHFKQGPRIEPSQIPTLNRLLQKGSAILIELSHPSLGRYSRVFEENDPIGKLIKEDISEPIYDEAIMPIKRDSKMEEFPIEDSKTVLAAASLTTKSHINVVNEKIKDTEVAAAATVSPPPLKDVPESIAKLLEEQKEAIHELLKWIHGAGMHWLNTLDEVGESIDEAQQLQKQHHSLSTRTEAVVDQAAEISEVVEFLIREGSICSSIYDPLKTLSTELENAVYDFRQRVKQQSLIRANSLRLHESVTEFYNESDGLLKVLCNEIRPMEETNCQTEMNDLNKYITVVEDRYQVANEVCTVFENLLNEEGEEKRKDDKKFIQEQLSLITERRKRCHELLDLHKLKLQQMIQLQTCELDQKQVIQWLEEITKQLKKDSFKYGLSQTAFNAKIIYFEKSAKSFCEYGKQLSQVSLLLRRSLRLEISPQLAICEKINSLSREFEHNLNRFKIHAI